MIDPLGHFGGPVRGLVTSTQFQTTIATASLPQLKEPVTVIVIYKDQTSLERTSPESLKFYNVLFGRIMGILKLVKMKNNNYFNPKAALMISDQK